MTVQNNVEILTTSDRKVDQCQYQLKKKICLILLLAQYFTGSLNVQEWWKTCYFSEFGELPSSKSTSSPNGRSSLSGRLSGRHALPSPFLSPSLSSSLSLLSFHPAVSCVCMCLTLSYFSCFWQLNMLVSDPNAACRSDHWWWQRPPPITGRQT